MTLFLIPALVLSIPGDPLGGEEVEKGFRLSDLTQELGSLDSMRVGGLLRASYDLADDELTGVAGDDLQALRLYDAQLWFSAEFMGYEVFVKVDAGEATGFPLPSPILLDDGVQTVDLRDAFVRKGIGEYLHVYVGQYKCPFIMSANVGDDSLAMIDRTRLGYLFAFPGAYQPGVALVGDYENFHLKVSVQNGADGATDGSGIVGRAEYQVGAGGKYREGAIGSEGFNGTFGVGYFKDNSDIAVVTGTEDFGSAWAADAYTTFDRFSLHAEILDFDEELARRALGNTTEDAMPYSTTVGCLFTEQIEAFVRYQDLDNEVDADIIGAGVNYYVAGHAMKWQLNASKYDDDNIDGTLIQAGLSIGYSQNEHY